MIKVLYIFLTLLMFPTMSSSSTKISLDDYINSFSWDRRIVLLISEEIHLNVINETDNFFNRNSCENEERNLEYIRIVGDDINKYIIPDRYKNKYGIWLIGYDGGDKSYSTDASLLKEIHSLIDTMPIRRSEMAEQTKKCN
tara:strand:- start:113 stop:535 length:423 start_codon:yes stop_codon:yes gene_type:complete